MKYRHKPTVTEAIQWTGDNIKEVLKFTKGHEVGEDFMRSLLTISTPNGMFSIQMEDWFVRGIQGEVYPVKGVVFKAIYEELPLEVSA